MLSACSINSGQQAETLLDMPTLDYIGSPTDDDLQGELTILVPSYRGTLINNDLRIYANFFTELHPNVTINFEGYELGFPVEMSQHIAVITNLIANPPDMVFFQNTISFEKTQHEAIFADLNAFIDGPRGIDRSKLFDNILRAAEIRGGLFHLPFYVDFEAVFLNQRLFYGIGVDTSEIYTLTIDQELDYFVRISEAFADEDIFYSRQFSLMQIMERSILYNIDTRDVFANTPNMHQRLELAMQVPKAEFVRGEAMHMTESSLVNFAPEGAIAYRSTFLPDAMRSIFLGRSTNMMWSFDWMQGGYHLLFLAQHPNMQFSHPVFKTEESGGIRFTSSSNYAIMRNAARPDLAWEFLRFILEFEENLFFVRTQQNQNPIVYHFARGGLPINRARFENQVRAVLHRELLYTLRSTNIGRYIGTNDQEHFYNPQDASRYVVDVAMDFLRTGMNMLDQEVRISQAVFHTLVYPDIWLLYSGQQDVARTLANIQNRLELYVHE